MPRRQLQVPVQRPRLQQCQRGHQRQAQAADEPQVEGGRRRTGGRRRRHRQEPARARAPTAAVSGPQARGAGRRLQTQKESCVRRRQRTLTHTCKYLVTSKIIPFIDIINQGKI